MSKVLVTGGNGFVAVQVVIAALEKGYQVVATVRSEAKAEQTRKALEKKVGSKASNVSFAIVPVVEAEGAYDEVLKANRFVAVLHTATPFHFNIKDPNEIVSPAVDGTKSILGSIKNLAPSVKRVVITSSFAAILDASKDLRPNYVYSEKDWNPITWEETVGGDPSSAYNGAKKWAEKAAWDFLEEEKPSFEIVTINPPWIFGEVAQHVESADQLNTSAAYLYTILTGQQKELGKQGVTIWSDVTDVAKAHVLAIDAPDAGNKRFFTIGDKPFSNKQISDIFIKHYPDLAPNVATKLPEGVAADGFPAGGYYTGDNSQSKKLLGIKFTDFEQSMVQFVESVKDLPRSSKQ